MEMLYQRDIYGKTLVELGKKNKDVVVFDADLSSSTRTKFFAKEFPDRFSPAKKTLNDDIAWVKQSVKEKFGEGKIE